MLEDMKKIEVVKSRLPLIVRILLALALTAVVAYAIAVFAEKAYYYPQEWKQYLWILAIGIACSYLVQMAFNTPVRRLLIRMGKGLVSMLKWNAESWLLQAFLWFTVCTYGAVVVIAISFVCAPFSAIMFVFTK